MLSLILAIILAIVGLFYVYITWRNDKWIKAGVPGPKPTPLFGNTKSIILQHRHITYEIDDIYKEYKKISAPFVGIFQMREPRLLIVEPELIRDIFVRKFTNFHDNEFGDWADEKSDPLLSRNPFMLAGEKWKEKRAEITPAFTSSRIKALSPLINGICKTLIKYIDGSAKPIETRELSAKFTTDVVSNCIFAVDANSFNDMNDEAVIRKMGKRLMAPSFKVVVYMILAGMFPALTKIYKLSLIPKDIETFFTNLMYEAEKHRNETKVTRVDYLDHLIQLKQKKGISNLDMAAHGVTFFVDGFETSSAAIVCALYQIAGHKAVQERLRQEINENVEADGNIPIEKLLDMKYLEQVLAESLRLCPPGVFLTKLCTESTEFNGIKDHKLKVDKGDVVIIPVYSIHRDAEYYPDPLQFDPERFSEKNGGVKAYEERGVYLPFGLGPRVCLGRRFATTQVKYAITQIVKNFEITVNSKTIEPLEMDPKEFIFVARGGLWLDYKKL